MFPLIGDPFNFMQVVDRYENQPPPYGGYALSKSLDPSHVQPLPDTQYHCISSSPTQTVPPLSPASNSSSSFDSPCGSPTSFTGDSMSLSPSSRASSPDPIPSTSSNASPTSSSVFPNPPSTSGHLKGEDNAQPRIKRPPNAFMCFRSYFCKNMPRDVERHNATVSKIVGIAWKRLSDEEKNPFKAQAAIITAEFMKQHPGWMYKPERDKPTKRKRRTQQRTLADERRYTRIALGFNSGKRGKELKRLAEMTEAVGTEEVFIPLPSAHRRRKSVERKKASTTTKPLVFTENLSYSTEGEPQPVAAYPQISVELMPSSMPVHPDEVPSSPRLSLCPDLQSDQDSFFSSLSIAYQSQELLDSSSILMVQDAYPQAQTPQQLDVHSFMYQLYESGVDSTAASSPGDYYQPQLPSTMSDQLSFDDWMKDFS